MQISEITRSDFEAFWPVFKKIIVAQETYAFDPEIGFQTAYDLWCLSPHKSYVIKENDVILGSYYIKANASGPSAHISNCGIWLAPKAVEKVLLVSYVYIRNK